MSVLSDKEWCKPIIKVRANVGMKIGDTICMDDVPVLTEYLERLGCKPLERKEREYIVVDKTDEAMWLLPKKPIYLSKDINAEE